MDQESRRVSLKWKIGGTFAGVMLVLGLFVTVAVYQLAKNALRDQLDQRVLLLANTLSDAAAGHIVFWRFMLSQENIRLSTAWHSLLSKTVEERSLSIPWGPFLRNSSKDFRSRGNGRPIAENYHCQEEPCTQPASPFLRDS